jgi:hypothetical protein
MQPGALVLRTTGLVLFSIFAVFYLVLLGPLDVYIYNREEFSSDPGEIVRFLLLSAIAVSAVVFLLLRLSPRPLQGALVRTLAFLAIGAWSVSNFLYGDYGRLDGTPLEIDPWSSLTLLQSAVLLILLVMVVKVSIDNLFKLITAVFVIGLASGIHGLYTIQDSEQEEAPTEFPRGLTEFSPSRNVIHVVLDELGSGSFRQILETDDDLKQAFDGFTVFTDTLSVFPSTEMSIIALMTGEVYRNEEPKRDFIRRIGRQNLGVERLEGLGYELHSHTRCQLGVVRDCTMVNSRLLTEDVVDIEALQLLDIFMFKSVPDYMKPDIYNEEKWLLLDLSDRNAYLKFQSGVAHLLFEKFLDEIAVSDSDEPRYKFFHSMVTHAPMDLDVYCNVVQEENRRHVTRIGFKKCGVRHFASLLHRLRELGVYDQTMIVLSSDHGDYWKGDRENLDEFEARGISWRVATKSQATLAVKPFDARGPVVMSRAQVSLRDVAATIFAAVGLDSDPRASPGARDVFSVGEEEIREREYLHYVWEHEYWAKEVLPPLTVFKVRGNSRDPGSWPDLQGSEGDDSRY